MFTLVKAETMPLTRELVEEHMKMEASPTERGLDPSRLKYLREKAENGELVAFNWAKAKIGGKTVRMNGQHSSTMLSELNGQFPEGLQVHMDTYKADAPTDLAVLFRQFDARKSSRTPSDVAGAYQGLHDDLETVPRGTAKLAVEGIAWHEKTIVGTRIILGDDQYKLFEDLRWHPFIKWMGELYSIKTPEMKNVAVAAALYATYHVNEGQARIFWDQVARGGVEFEDSAPSSVLDNWLKTAAKTDEKRRLKLKPAHFYQGCIFAWNAFREEKELKEIRSRVDKGLLEPIG